MQGPHHVAVKSTTTSLSPASARMAWKESYRMYDISIGDRPINPYIFSLDIYTASSGSYKFANTALSGINLEQYGTNYDV